MMTFEQFREWALNQGIPEHLIEKRYEQWLKSFHAQEERSLEID